MTTSFTKDKLINITSNKSIVEACIRVIDINDKTTRIILINNYINTLPEEYRTILNICIKVFIKNYDKLLFPKIKFIRFIKYLFIKKFDELNLKISNNQELINFIKNTPENIIITKLNLKIPKIIKHIILIIIQNLRNNGSKVFSVAVFCIFLRNF